LQQIYAYIVVKNNCK